MVPGPVITFEGRNESIGDDTDHQVDRQRPPRSPLRPHCGNAAVRTKVVHHSVQSRGRAHHVMG
jgi:hypothetical protein